ncbi:putative CtpA-like serine protease [Polystyrenella longa]|uniref:Putative CtpA-like serine protease n=1 Tax=Polystyrenella longa TaxID=2528007 RepID=A0A518CL73_9PLAN|nr:S41 family peptidase [Polystyrenella longa]QDU79969.1 putative CtpA-like serine protease [Polystyrenella longa]
MMTHQFNNNADRNKTARSSRTQKSGWTANQIANRIVGACLLSIVFFFGAMANGAEPERDLREWLNQPLSSQQSYDYLEDHSNYSNVADPFASTYDNNQVSNEGRSRAPDRWYDRYHTETQTEVSPSLEDLIQERIEQMGYTRPVQDYKQQRPVQDRREQRPDYERSYYAPSDSGLNQNRDQNFELNIEKLKQLLEQYQGQPQSTPVPTQPSVQPTQPTTEPASTLSPKEERDRKLAARYGDPVIGRFIMGVSTQQALSLYQETARLIDTRHIEPTSYKERVEYALGNLDLAIQNQYFLSSNQISPSSQQISNFRNGLRQIHQNYPTTNASQAMNLINQTINMAQQTVGLRGSAVVTEFVFAATETLDKYSAFVPEDIYRKPSATLEDHIVGIGVEIKPEGDSILVVKALPGGPAANAGLKAGDLIMSIDGQSVSGKTLDWVVDRITGAEGSRIVLGMRRDSKNANVTLVRSRVTIQSVSEFKMVSSDVGYLKLEKFAKSSNEEMDKALWSLHNSGMKSLVIDLRGNPGGLLTTAIELSNKFITSGTIVSTRGRTAGDQSQEVATYEQTWKTPLVVLVDGNSASASEIFAAAIQENGRGIVVGERSYGKGTVQTHFPLQSVSGNLRITTAKFYSPNGREMAGAGVTPDITVQNDNYSGQDLVLERATEAARSTQAQNLAQGNSRNQNQTYPSLSSF